MTEQYLITLDEFLKKAADDAGTQLIIFYHPNHSIDKEGSLVDETPIEYKEAFANSCNKYGIIFVDLSEEFEKAYKENYILTHGFINTAVGYGHLNKYGHQIAAETIADVIGGLENDTE